MDLQRYLADEPILAGPPSTRYRLRKFIRRNKGPVLAVTVIFFLLLSGIVGTTWGMIRAEHHWQLSEAKEKEARTARDHTITALRDMTDEIIVNQMARDTMLTDENKEFLRRIIQHFEGFAAITADDGESRSIRGEGYYWVGGMRHALGELQEAETALTKALSIFQQLVTDFPTRPEFRLGLARSHNELGELHRAAGHLKEAESAYTDALVLKKQLAAEVPTQPQFRLELAMGHYNLCLLLLATGRLKEAETGLTEALALQQQLATEFPIRRGVRHVLAMIHHSLGHVYLTTARSKEAEAMLMDAIALYKKLVADSFARPEYRKELARCYNSLALLCKNTGRLQEAEAAFTNTVDIRKQLVAQFPIRPEFRQELAASYNNLGALFGMRSRLREAETVFTNALALQKQLVADFPTRPEFRQELAASHINMGNVFRATGRLKNAELAFTDALNLQKQLAADFPNNSDLRNAVAGTFVNLALLAEQRKDFPRAKTFLEEGLPHHLTALKINPRHPEYRRFFRNHLQVLVEVNAMLQDQSAAVQAAQQRNDLGWDPPTDAYDAACALAHCIAVVEKDTRLDAAQRQAAVQFYGDQAMKMLRTAVARGYSNANRWKTDINLAPLRQREDFQKLLVELEAGKK
jgi:tetratricopeptide (TPR) repeat protein